MKKGLICILSLMMVLGLGACSSNGGKTTGTGERRLGQGRFSHRDHQPDQH